LLLPPLLPCLRSHSPALIHVCLLLFAHSCSYSPTLSHLHLPTLIHIRPFVFTPRLRYHLLTHPHTFICSCPSVWSCLRPFVCAHTHSFMPACGSQCRRCPHSRACTLSFICAYTTFVRVHLCLPSLFVLPGTHS